MVGTSPNTTLGLPRLAVDVGKSLVVGASVGRNVTLTLSGESPLKYFDRAPTVAVTVGTREVARFNPSSDFTQEIVLPADALAAADGRVVVASDKFFVPAERDGSADQRHLALQDLFVFGEIAFAAAGCWLAVRLAAETAFAPALINELPKGMLTNRNSPASIASAPVRAVLMGEGGIEIS